jgi:DNA-binding NarL/FixJ family response regulator
MRQRPRLRGAVVLIVSDDRTSENELIEVLEGHGCSTRCPGPKLSLDLDEPCDVGIIAVHEICGWTAGVVTALRASAPACAALILLGVGGPEEIARSLRAGAVDCLVKPVSPGELLEGLSNAVACTQRWRRRVTDATPHREPRDPSTAFASARTRLFEPVREPAATPRLTEQRTEDVVSRLASQNQLTPREREVLYWLLHGHRYDDIATALGVTPRTAKFHAANLLRKLDIDSRHELPRLLTKEA